jgi:glycosyltransferase involved in cell wall biosynthesis
MYCGNCLRDNSLVAALRSMGHRVLMVPLYLPLTLDETDQSAGTPILFSGINVYLDQKSPWFRKAPRWLHQLLSSPFLLKWAARQSANTRAQTLGPVTLSMLRGEAGNQAPELSELVTWLKSQPRPDVIFLSNALLLGMAQLLKTELERPIVCMLQGEDYFLDSLPEPYRGACWETLSKRAKDADLFVAPSRYFADLMRKRLGLPARRVKVVYNGITLEGYEPPSKQEEPFALAEPHRSEPPVLGFFARMCREKGLDTLIDAFIELRKRSRLAGLKLCVAGSLGPADEPFVLSLRERLESEGLRDAAAFHSNVDRATKLALLKSFSVFSVPALYGEAFGLYVLEAMAAGVPVIQPNTAAFPELLELTGGGVLCAVGSPQALADTIESLLVEPSRARNLGAAGRRVVFDQLSSEAMAGRILEAVQSLGEQPKENLELNSGATAP